VKRDQPDTDDWKFLGQTPEGGRLFWTPVGTEPPTTESINAAYEKLIAPLPPAPRRFEVGVQAREILLNISVTATPRFGVSLDPLRVDIVTNPDLDPLAWVLYDSANNEMGRGVM
jgi:hypothetical protein